jgi:transposase
MTVILSDIEGMSYEEVSEAMKCSLGTVRSRLHRGRKQLRDKIVAFEKGQAAALAKKERLTSASAAPTAKPVSLSAARSSHE